MKIVALIPARYASTRFPKKPLVPILGKPMILWVAELTAKAIGSENTYVATDHRAIADVVESAGFKVVMTSPDALTGTDRIAEAAQSIDADVFINVQGDEPMLDPASIRKIADAAKQYPESVINGYAEISDQEEPDNRNIPKCVLASDERLLYMSRLAVPGHKDESMKPSVFHKQVCIYAFNKKHLDDFSAQSDKAPCERAEDIEILRFLDLGHPIQMIELPGDTLAVDVPEDVDRVESAMRAANA